MKIIPILILTLFLQGCALFNFFRDPQLGDQKVTLAAESLTYCPPLKEEINPESFEAFLIEYADLATLYGKCANKQATSVKLLKQFGNIK